MSIPIKLTPHIQRELNYLQELNGICTKYNHKLSKYNIISKAAENIVAYDMNGYVPKAKTIVDVIAGDGTTIQVKSVNRQRNEVTINYRENKSVDLLAIIEFNNEYTGASYLYLGPFREFIECALMKTEKQVGSNWDNHYSVKKTYINELQERFGMAQYKSLSTCKFFKYI